jgi:hypothetical protein
MHQSKLAHSDGKLDSCLTFHHCQDQQTPTQQQQQQQQPKNSSWSAFIQYPHSQSIPASSSMLNDESITLVDGLTTLTFKQSTSPSVDSPYEHELWYFGSISRNDAETHLKGDRIVCGDYLIRNSERKVDKIDLIAY